MSTSENCIKRVERIVDEEETKNVDNEVEREIVNDILEDEVHEEVVVQEQKSLIDQIRDKCIDIKYKILFKITDLEFYFNSHPERKLDCLVYLACMLFGLIVFMGCMMSDS